MALWCYATVQDRLTAASVKQYVKQYGEGRAKTFQQNFQSQAQWWRYRLPKLLHTRACAVMCVCVFNCVKIERTKTAYGFFFLCKNVFCLEHLYQINLKNNIRSINLTLPHLELTLVTSTL